MDGRHRRPFLTARWESLVLLNYPCPAALLAPLVPAGTQLDPWAGGTLVSLVGFRFEDTRLAGVPIPFHRAFDEVNLRFYVRRETEGELRRGVVFVKEIVPRFAIAKVARTLYGEPYECWQMSHDRTGGHVEYGWNKGNCRNRISVKRGESLGVPAEGSHGEFIIEHYWGYTKRGPSRTDEYKVEHPKWELFKAEDARIDVDFTCTYGPDFAFLNDQPPYSVLLARGSEISVYKGKTIHL